MNFHCELQEVARDARVRGYAEAARVSTAYRRSGRSADKNAMPRVRATSR